MATKTTNRMDATARFKPYPEYTDSAVEWLRKVPSHWRVKRLKHVASMRFSNVDKKSHNDESPVRLCNYVDVYYNDYITDAIEFMEATATRDEITRFSLSKGDVLITKDSESWDDIAVPACVDSELQGVLCGYHLAQIRPHSSLMDGRFLFRAFAAHGIRDQFNVAATGITRYGLSKDSISSSLFLVPPLPEQRTIAAFLDRETAKIDGLVAKKERLIELLQEKRTALISHAVTKGLNPDAKMKDSGVEWIGEVPERWEVLALKRICHRVDVGIAEAATHAYADEGVPIIRSTNVRPNRIDESDILRIEPWFAERNKSKYLRAGDLVTVRTGHPGITAVVPETLNLSQCFTLVMSTLRDDQNPHFFAYFLNSYSGKTNFALTGWGTAQTNISVPIVAETQVTRPPVDEQGAIVEYLDSQTGSLDDLARRAQDGIAVLTEYRSALISAAVTGKIDVRRGS